MSEMKKTKKNKDIVPLEEISTWDSYFTSNSDRLLKLDKNQYTERFSISKPEVRTELNEAVSIWKGDITKLEVDAIVNAANNTLLGGMGVDGAIHKAAGRLLYEECKTLQGCETGDAKITGGYQLPAKNVIHTVGPRGGGQSELLESCYKVCLKKLLENNLRSVAFPCISTGIYGFPQDSAANIALKTVRTFLENSRSSVDRIIFCLFLEKDVEIYETLMQIYFPVN